MTIAHTLISSVKVLSWLKQLDWAGHWLEQHTAPVSSKPYNRPRLEGTCYKYRTSCSYQSYPDFPIRHAHTLHTLDCYMVSALMSRVGWTSARNNERTNKQTNKPKQMNKQMNELQPFQRYGWRPPKFKWFT